MNLFNINKIPLAHKYRPEKIEDFYGQVKIKSMIEKMIKNDKFISSIFYGPSGSGKTTLAKIIANKLGYEYVYLNAIKASKQDIIDVAIKSKKTSSTILLFLDEIHRFNKLQQDSLLENLEFGDILLIGATTENPTYSLNKSLLSRVLLLKFEEVSEKDILEILKKISFEENIIIRENVLELLSKNSKGDVRHAINMLETLINSEMVDADIEDISMILNIRNYSEKYDTISAFIKSIRGSDPDSAIYWLAKMLVGNEDILYIARRLAILASEDIGLANSNASILASSVLNIVKEIGMPEARIPLAHLTVYLALSPKSNSVYKAINNAMEEIENKGSQKVPVHLTKVGVEKYIYPHDFENNYVNQKYMENKMKFYFSGNNKFEKSMDEIWKKIKKEKD